MQFVIPFQLPTYVYDGTSTSLSVSLYKFGLVQGTPNNEPIDPKWIAMADSVMDVAANGSSTTTVTSATIDGDGNLTIDFTTSDAEGVMESITGFLVINT
jgi:hypothetical protein